jgi:hypothetical protein
LSMAGGCVHMESELPFGRDFLADLVREHRIESPDTRTSHSHEYNFSTERKSCDQTVHQTDELHTQIDKIDCKRRDW